MARDGYIAAPSGSIHALAPKCGARLGSCLDRGRPSRTLSIRPARAPITISESAEENARQEAVYGMAAVSCRLRTRGAARSIIESGCPQRRFAGVVPRWRST